MSERPLTISALHAAYAAGADPKSILHGVYASIAAADDPGIFLTLVEQDDALAAAEQLGAFDPIAKPLWGVPFAVKDNIDVAGLPTTAACPAFAYTPEKSATAVQRLIDAGAILIGKTNLDQFATGLVGVRTPYPVPRNAIDASLVPGGSSSGSAVAVARGLVAFALGTDTAGSGRVPAALNNIVGLKPSLGAVSTSGVVPACRTLDCVSVFALEVADAWRALAAMSGPDASDPYSRPVELGRPHLPPVVRIGIPDRASREFCGDQRAEAAFEQALSDLRRLADETGHRIELSEIDLAPFREVAELLYAGPWVAERYQAIRGFMQAHESEMFPVTREIIAAARRFTAADTFAGQYRLAELARATRGTWDAIDVMLVPSIPTVVTLEEIARDPVGANSRLGTYTNFVNLLDLCALAVPGRFRSDGRAAGITLIGPRGADGLLAGLGAVLHAAAGILLGATAERLPSTLETPVGAPPGYIEIAVVGAHMAGLPLNGELRSKGGIFVREAATEPCYRLFALAGPGPKRPGLLRVRAGEGHSIATEVWALPAEGFAEVVAAIPSPLGIGTLRLADGTQPKGFLSEPSGLDDATEISRFGGWRRYLAAQAAAGE